MQTEIQNKIKSKIKGDGQECPSHTGLATKNNFGMEQGAGDAGGDGDQVCLAAEDFDLAGAGQFGEINGASASDASDGGFVGGDGWKVGQEFAGVDETIVQRFRRPSGTRFSWLGLSRQ